MDPTDNNGNIKDIQLKALKVLIDGIKMAQKRGAYELPEAVTLWNAIKIFMLDDDIENPHNSSIDMNFQNAFSNN